LTEFTRDPRHLGDFPAFIFNALGKWLKRATTPVVDKPKMPFTLIGLKASFHMNGRRA
jgi:hypothetical protein